MDFTEVEEALLLIKSRKAKEEQNLEFLEKVDDEKIKGESPWEGQLGAWQG